MDGMRIKIRKVSKREPGMPVTEVIFSNKLAANASKMLYIAFVFGRDSALDESDVFLLDTDPDLEMSLIVAIPKKLRIAIMDAIKLTTVAISPICSSPLFIASQFVL
jgi:hypothetical protein